MGLWPVYIAPDLPDAVRHHDCICAIVRGARPADFQLDRFDLNFKPLPHLFKSIDIRLRKTRGLRGSPGGGRLQSWHIDHPAYVLRCKNLWPGMASAAHNFSQYAGRRIARLI